MVIMKPKKAPFICTKGGINVAKYIADELRHKAIGAFASTCVYILQIENGIEDRLQVFYNATDADGYLLGRPSWCKVRYTQKGEAFILHHGRRYSLRHSIKF